MRLFSRLFDRTLELSRHPRAPWYLAALSFAESSFFPIPPDVMLGPMVLARPERAWALALLTTLASVAGAVIGYLIGMLALDFVVPAIEYLGYADRYAEAQAWFRDWGFLAILVAAFTPIPYKLFTIAAGAMSMMLVPFLAASVIGRGARFFLVAALVAWGGPRVEAQLRRHVDTLGWLVLGLIVIYVALRR